MVALVEGDDVVVVAGGFEIEDAAASKIMDLDYKIARTWIGCYSQRKSGEIYHYTIDDRIHIVTAIGGKGMTGSLGWAEEHINKLF